MPPRANIVQVRNQHSPHTFATRSPKNEVFVFVYNSESGRPSHAVSSSSSVTLQQQRRLKDRNRGFHTGCYVDRRYVPPKRRLNFQRTTRRYIQKVLWYPIACWKQDLVKILCFWILSIVLSLSKTTVLFIFQNTAFRRLDSVSVFR
jgi:hypothetical protein